jgi:hypothetical protein
VARLAVLAATLVTLTACSPARLVARGMRFFAQGESIQLRARTPTRTAPRLPALLVLAIDGMDREILYEALRSGAMPRLAAELGPRAHFDETLTAVLPSSTAVAWASVMTGASPGVHGIVGNEFFLRRERRLVAPVPASVADPSDVLATFTDGLLNDLLLTRTVYERMRERDPSVRIWVAMHQIQRGADTLLLPDRLALLDAFRVVTQEALMGRGDDDSMHVYQELDEDIVASVCKRLDRHAAPDVLTVYLPGNDLFAHSAHSGPDPARRRYARDALDPAIGKLFDAMGASGALADRSIVVTSDHGHTRVVHDDHHSLGTDDAGEPGQVLTGAGFRVRPFQLVTPSDADYNAVLAYQGAFGYVYLTDRTDCLEPAMPCDWRRPPRFTQEVLRAAEAFWQANRNGLYASGLYGALELVLVRVPADARVDGPFAVYAGEGRLQSIGEWYAANPHPTWVHFEERLRGLLAGPGAERVGDVVLISRAGDEVPLEERRYFAPPYRSYHGSPARKDSEVPLIVARPGHGKAATSRFVAAALGDDSTQAAIAKLLLALRFGLDADGTMSVPTSSLP